MDYHYHHYIDMENIAIVIPTIREQSYKEFLDAWQSLFFRHNIELITVFDGEKPMVKWGKYVDSIESVMSSYSDVIYNKNDGIRNLGFAVVAKYMPEIETIITFDDDVRPPKGKDPIQEHLEALEMKVPVTWMSTASEYMRGFPYNVRQEAEVVLSHGVWNITPDFDAPTQLVKGIHEVSYYKGPIPKGVLFPMCIMNVAFKRKMLPYMYQAPMGYKVGLDRFGDIWGGVETKKDIDSNGWAVVSGYSTIDHIRASNVFTNLQKEAKGLSLNEEYGKDDYFTLFREKRDKWQEFIKMYI